MALVIDPVKVRDAQQALSVLGYGRLAIDGIIGVDTRHAVLQFKIAHHTRFKRANNLLDEATYEKLMEELSRMPDVGVHMRPVTDEDMVEARGRLLRLEEELDG